MKSAVYAKAGQVGLATIERPQIIDADDAIIRHCPYFAFVVRTLELPELRKSKKDIEIAVTRRSELSKKLVRTLLQ